MHECRVPLHIWSEAPSTYLGRVPMCGDRLLCRVRRALLCGVHDGRWRLKGRVDVAVAVGKANDGLVGRSCKVRNVHRRLLHIGRMGSVTGIMKGAAAVTFATTDSSATSESAIGKSQEHRQPG